MHTITFWARRALITANRVLTLSFGYFMYLCALARNRSCCIVEEWSGEGDLDSATHVAVFCHYDRYGVLHDYVAYYLEQLRAAGYWIVFVSNAPILPQETLTTLQSLCCSIIRRKNLGHDFGAYKEAIAKIPRLDRLETLILTNDSVYGPFTPMGPILERADPSLADVWSMTDCWDRRYHLQSYFLLFHRAAIQHPRFIQFWRTVRFVQSKSWVINAYEVGLSKALLAGGLRCRALFPYRDAAIALTDLIRRSGVLDGNKIQTPVERVFVREIYGAINAGIPLNPTHFFWDHLIGRMGCPFIKRDLLATNPAGVPLLQYWEQASQNVSDYDTGLIVRHLQLSLRNRSV